MTDAQDLHRIKPDKTQHKKGLWSPIASWGDIDNWLLLGEEELVFFRDEYYKRLQYIVLYIQTEL